MKRHLRLDVKGTLRNGVFTGFTDGAGNPMPEEDVRRNLIDLLADGVRFLPMGDCDNWSDEEGCLGHPDGDDDE